MKTEKEVIKQIIDLAKEYGKKSVELKTEADRVIEDTPKSIDNQKQKVKLIARELGQIEYAINQLVQIFE